MPPGGLFYTICQHHVETMAPQLNCLEIRYIYNPSRIFKLYTSDSGENPQLEQNPTNKCRGLRTEYTPLQPSHGPSTMNWQAFSSLQFSMISNNFDGG